MCNYSEKLNWFTTDRLESLVDSHFSEERNCCKREIGDETGLTCLKAETIAFTWWPRNIFGADHSDKEYTFMDFSGEEVHD